MKHFTVNEQQLELLSNIPLYQILERFDEPSTPSEVAKRLGKPANTVHYHVKRLVAAKLLRCAERNGRQCRYQRVSNKFRFHESLLPAYEHQSSQDLAQHLKKVQKHFSSQAEKTQTDDFPRDKQDPSFCLPEFKDFENMEPVSTLAMTLEVSLTKKQHAKFVKALEDLFAEIRDGVSTGEEDYTFCLLTCPGRAATEANPL